MRCSAVGSRVDLWITFFSGKTGGWFQGGKCSGNGSLPRRHRASRATVAQGSLPLACGSGLTPVCHAPCSPHSTVCRWGIVAPIILLAQAAR